MEAAEEPPSVLWGLDPLLSAFTRLYVRDILDMTESTQVPGIYFYNQHPVYKVDVLGTVVYTREREDFFCYGVDDGTGVISCLCWKRDSAEEDEAPAGAASGHGASAGFDPVSELRRLRREQRRRRRRLEIGELLRVRGPVKTSRWRREIMASVYYKVDDPVMALQIAWMMEVPRLYRECYDKPLRLSDSAKDSDLGPLSRAVEVLKAFLERECVCRFRAHDVQDLLQPLLCGRPPHSPAHQEAPAAPSPGPSPGPSAAQQLRQLLQETLRVLQDEGVVYCKVKSQDEVYTVTAQDKDLLMAVRDVVREDSRRDKYAEKGCHVLYILSAVRQRFSLNVSKAALDLVLNSLECNSDIISTSDNHYTAA